MSPISSPNAAQRAGMSSPQIRPAEISDIGDLLPMISALLPEIKDQLHLDDWSLIDLIVALSPWAHILVADTKDGVIGYTIIVGGLHLNIEDRYMELHHLYVRPEYRGLGIGRDLMSAACKKAEQLGCGQLTVGIAHNSEDAKAAYRALGFERNAPRAPRYVMALAEAS